MSEPSRALIQAVAVTAELTGTELSVAAADVMCRELAAYPEDGVLRALSRCRRELKGRLSIADVIARIDDGRPGADEAWAMVPRSERETVVWTDEMRTAWAIAEPLAHDEVAARMAFRDAYQRAVTEARAARRPVRWSVSIGWDRDGREPVVRAAVEAGRLTADEAKLALPSGNFEEAEPVPPRLNATMPMRRLV